VSELMFNKYSLHEVFSNQEKTMAQHINSLQRERLLTTSLENLEKEILDQFMVHAPQIAEDQASVSDAEVDLDVSQDPLLGTWWDRSRPMIRKGTRYSLHIPYSGDRNLFWAQPSTTNFNPPSAEVNSGEVIYSVEGVGLAPERIKAAFDQFKNNLSFYLEHVRGDVQAFNSKLPDLIKRRLRGREAKIKQDQSVASQLGYPIKQS